MNNAIHIEVEVVEFFIVWIGAGDVYRDPHIADLLRLLLDDWGHNFRILLGKPSEECYG